MKKTAITISFDDEKLSALKMYLEQKGQTVEEELENQLAVLYGKTVPAGVREFLELKSGGTGTVPKPKRMKPSPSSAVGEKTGMNENG